MVDRLNDVWWTRDFPVLVEVTRRVDAGERFFHPSVVAAATGLSLEDTVLSLVALERRELVEFTRNFGGPDAGHVDNVSGEAYLLTGLHPSGDDAVSALVEALHQAADLTPDPAEKSRLRALADAALGVGREVLGGVLVALASRGMFGS